MFWLPQSEVLLDIRVIDTDDQSYSHRSPRDVIKMAENKKKKYSRACDDRRAQFIRVSVDGVFGSEAETFIKVIADNRKVVNVV